MPIRWVQASSAEIFGEPTTSPQTEETPLAPVNPYGAAKAYGHLLTGVYRARGMHASTVVLYNHESPRRPERFVTRKITAGVARIAAGQQSELVLGNLDARRDWGWAPDYAKAMWLASEREAAGDYVIATGQAHSVRDFVGAALPRWVSPTGSTWCASILNSSGPWMPTSWWEMPARPLVSWVGDRR
ncbi:GDP-mannose 4,6-dehydratase [Ornithinimicrobium sp. INDO-MA30-4]|uniref:GDP-mannose 4,6-dehydratase n=1 Tax=Ornithinimicrobium sp. INDO-MA30-4 TaxID=2908651 RepID=UPI0021A68EB3|nr:GDP-mannose 4,6-dehydratase [Ornithinimicrobium sp. INDO-MA30-4]